MDNEDLCDSARCFGTAWCLNAATRGRQALPCEWDELKDAVTPDLRAAIGQFYPTWLTHNYKISDDS